MSTSGTSAPQTAKHAGYMQPAEWSRHAATWTAWPSDGDLWMDNLGPAREAFTNMVLEVSRGERVNVLAADEANEELARVAFAGADVRVFCVPFGDIWLRDTAPIFVRRDGELACARFAFNGWGGKYVLEHDDRVSERVAALTGLRTFAAGWVLEGGSIDVDGEGTCLTTKQCLLNANRNPNMTAADIEAELGARLGITRTIWLGDGLMNDHTDGHVDNVARFVAPGVALCMEAKDADDPNRDALEAIATTLAASTDAKGRRIEVVRIPSPGKVTNEDGQIIPASYANFYIANRSVVVPTYDTKWDAEATKAIARCFPDRSTVGIPARAILSGGGAFHCITQQEPTRTP